jgi:hypothetical protein
MTLAAVRCVGKQLLAVSSRAGRGGCLRTVRHCSFAFLSHDRSEDWLNKRLTVLGGERFVKVARIRVFSLNSL